GRRQGVLARGIQQRMASRTQKHKAFSRCACACSHGLCFGGQRNRWMPHARLLQGGRGRSSSTYKSTEPPTVSPPSALLSKQLISVLALARGEPAVAGAGLLGVHAAPGGDPHGD